MIPGTGTGAGRWGWLSPDLGNALSYLLFQNIQMFRTPVLIDI